MLLSTVAYECGVDIQQCSTSRESLRRARIENRHSAAKQIKENFNPTVPLTIHWDGKLLLDLNDRDHVHRLPVLVTGYGIEKLLAVPKLECGTGRQMAQATVNARKDWNIPFDPIVACCFDTTSSNTGIHAGACSVLEQLIEKSLLRTACRHHIHEVVLCHVYKTCFGPALSPEVIIFQRFREYWSKMNPDVFQAVQLDDKEYSSLPAAAVAFARKTLQGKCQP
jgi:hypothetical protein